MEPKRVDEREIIIEFSKKMIYRGNLMGNVQLDGESFTEPKSYDPLSIGYKYIKRIRDKDGNILWENEEYKERKPQQKKP